MNLSPRVISVFYYSVTLLSIIPETANDKIIKLINKNIFGNYSKLVYRTIRKLRIGAKIFKYLNKSRQAK
jgi:hypothetical protein